MANKYITLEISYSWWFKWLYRPMFIFMSDFIRDYIDIDFEPNREKFHYYFKKAIKFKRVKD